MSCNCGKVHHRPKEKDPFDTSIDGEGLEKAALWLKEADLVLVGAGAGLSAAAGNDYTSQDEFKKQISESQNKVNAKDAEIS